MITSYTLNFTGPHEGGQAFKEFQGGHHQMGSATAVIIEFLSPQAGTIESVRIKKGDTVKVGQVLFTL